MYLVYHFNAATAVNAISVFNGNDSKTGGGWDSAGRSPKAWTFEGSHDGSAWTTLDTQTGETGWGSYGEERYYSFNNSTAYEYYKFDCTALNDEVSFSTNSTTHVSEAQYLIASPETFIFSCRA